MILVGGAVLLPLVPPRLRSSFCLLLPALALFLLLFYGRELGAELSFLQYQLQPVIAGNGLSIPFGYVMVIMAFIGGLFAFHSKDLGQQIAALLYAGSSLGVVFAGDLFTLFVFWEGMALASAYLIFARRTERSRGAGWRYLWVHLAGSAVLMAGIMLHIADTGSLAFGLFDPAAKTAGAWLILIGFAVNAAIPPLHAWLSDAYPEATVTGSVFLSAFTTKTAVYVLAVGFAGWDLLIWAGVTMALYGVVYAILANDIRRLLAYHIISQVGYMVAAVGIGTELAVNGATAHAFAHIIYKGLMFMGVGVVLHTVGTAKASELGGFAKAMPVVMVLYMVGAVSISGFPLFSGFVSKSMVIAAAFEDHRDIVGVLLSVASVGTFLSTGLKLPYFTWFGRNRGATMTRGVPVSMYVGMAAAAVLCLVIGVYPHILYKLLPYAVHYEAYTSAHLMETAQILVGTALVFYLLIKVLQPHDTIALDVDWLYRKGARPAYVLLVEGPAWVFTRIEEKAVAAINVLTRLATNPVAFFPAAARRLGIERSALQGDGSSPPPFNPDRYRLSVGLGLGLVVMTFVVVIAWALLVQ
ncbi:MAG: multicomponent Na+:H+ antiporter subunit D [Chloroflexi bacterium]|jgi:multicomponent Na+:H+ antiporter subunit D|nr:MAG: multicomponent Na+:H+ antiporter subunit D [Chloroflexota bacterium]